MDPAPVSAAARETAIFEDGLGERYRVLDPVRNEPVEMLCLRGELTAVPSFEFALRERVSRMASFHQGCYASVLSVERLKETHATLALVSEHRAGVRLSRLLAFAESGAVPLNIDAALCLVRQLVPAVAMLHESAADISHGAIAPERIIVTPGARVVVVEHVLGAALEQLRYSHERYWNDLRIGLPRSAGAPRFDHRADVMQIGLVSLALLIGRPIADDEYPARIGEILASTWAISARGGLEPLPAGLRVWLTRALQLDSKNWFRSAVEAQEDLERVLGESDYLAAPATLETFLAAYQASAGPPAPAAVADPPRPVRQPAPPAIPAAVRASAPPPVAQPAPAPAPVAARVAGSVEQPAAARPAPEPVRKEFFVPPAPDYPAVEEEAVTPRPQRSRWQLVAAAVALVALAGAGITAARRFAAPSAAVATDGTLVVNTNPPGARVFVDGVERGATPLTLTLNAGPHSMEVRGDGPPRVMPITISAGGQVAQFIDLPKGPALVGQLQVRTEPAGARVSVDGVEHGTAPLTIADLQPGEHVVVVESSFGTMKQTVVIEAGIMASLTVPLAGVEGAPVSGWIALSAPAEVQVFEGGRLLGSSQSDRLMVSAGRHEFEIVNTTLGYRAARVVQVAPGRVTPINVDFPKGTIALNAIPWAEVWVDGAKIGDTPIGNVELLIGSHEIVFRNPDLGEQRHAVTISVDKPARLSVDLRKK